MVKNCSEKKFRFRKRYLLLLVLVVIVILAFCWCGRGGIVSSEAAAQVTAIDIQGDANQTIVQLAIADGALPQAQWRTLEAGEDTYSVQGLAPDPALGAYAVELTVSGSAFAPALLEQYGLTTNSMKQLGYDTVAESLRLATVEGENQVILYVGFSQPAQVKVEQQEGCITLTIAAKPQ